MHGSDWPKTSLQTAVGGMEIRCRLVFTCLSKAKINRLKQLLESKIPDKHSKTQTAPLGATTH